MNCAYTVTFNNFHSHIAWLTPSSSPWVSHNPVVNSWGSSPTDYICSMVDIGSTAVCSSVNTCLIILKTTFSVNTNWKRTWSKSGLHGRSTCCSYIYKTSWFNTGACSSVLACSISASVGISRFWHRIISLVVSEGVCWEPSTAAIISLSSRTVNELLFWEG